MTPVIGIATQYDHDPEHYSPLSEYIDWLAFAGAAVVVLNPADPALLASALSRVDGLIVPGGDDDVEPSRYGQDNEGLSTHPSRARDDFEDLLVRLTLELDMPFLGVCRGCQIANVSLGGSLWQDIEREVGAGMQHVGGARHDVMSVKGEPLFELGERFEVNSYHHQAIRRLADGLRPMAASEDGIVEAYRRPSSSFFWGIQWHPERDIETPSSQLIVEELVSAAERYSARIGTGSPDLDR